MNHVARFRASFAVRCLLLVSIISVSSAAVAREAKNAFSKAAVGRAPIGLRPNASAPAGEVPAGLLAGLNGAILELYDDFALVEISESDKDRLKERGDAQAVPVTVRDEFDQIFLNGITIDAREPTAIPPGHSADPPYANNEQGTWVVQFIGPIKQEWLDHVETLGIVPVQYVSMHAYIVGARETAIRAIEHLPYIQWTSQLHRFLKTLHRAKAGTRDALDRTRTNRRNRDGSRGAPTP